MESKEIVDLKTYVLRHKVNLNSQYNKAKLQTLPALRLKAKWHVGI